MRFRIAIAEDDAIQSDLLQNTLTGEGYDVVAYPDGQSALEAIEAGATRVDVLVSDVSMPRLDGLKLTAALKQSRPDLPVIVVTADASVDNAVSALRAGAWDFLTKPLEVELLLPCVRRAVERQRLHRELKEATASRPASESGLFGQSDAMRGVRELVTRVAPSGASVLVHGETGTGKELVARALHSQSPRASNPFVAINCAALPAALVESELFGYAKGAFTDARAARQGLFVEANGGTLFLDEVAELSLDNQAKLLRALQERTVRPLGSNTEVSFDARILAATHRDLESEVEAGKFRQDLFYRLNVIRIDLPPLRDRGMDIVHLGTRFLANVCERDKRPTLQIPADVAQKLLAYSWPGNVRELENCVERLAALARGNEVAMSDLPDGIKLHERERFAMQVDAAEEVVTLEELEKRYVLRVLQLVKDNRSRAAQMLGIDRRTLYRRLEGWGLPTERAEGGEVTPGAAS